VALKFQDFEVYRNQGFVVSRNQGVEVSGFQDCYYLSSRFLGSSKF
jgi:hypothetical protein